MPMKRADITVDVTAACAIDRPLSIVATAYLPPPERLNDGHVVVFAMPGGGYSRSYFDMGFEGHSGYSQAAHHVERGLVVVSIDHLGVGDTSPEVAEVLRMAHAQLRDNQDCAVGPVSALVRRALAAA